MESRLVKFPAGSQVMERIEIIAPDTTVVFHSKYERPCLKYLADNVSPEDKLGNYLVRIGHEDTPCFQGAVIAGRIMGEDDSDGVHYGVKFPIEVRATGSKNFRSVDMILDTGASDTFITGDVTTAIKCPSISTFGHISTLSSKRTKVGVHEMDMRISGKSVSFRVFDSGQQGLNVLGNDYLKYHEIRLNPLSSAEGANTLELSGEGRSLLKEEDEATPSSASSSSSSSGSVSLSASRVLESIGEEH